MDIPLFRVVIDFRSSESRKQYRRDAWNKKCAQEHQYLGLADSGQKYQYFAEIAAGRIIVHGFQNMHRSNLYYRGVFVTVRMEWRVL